MADVSRPLLGADFLRANALLVDLKSECLVDARTYHFVCIGKDRAIAPRLNAIATSANQFVRLLSEFPDITAPNFTQLPIKHGVEHFISTKGLPISARAHCLQTSYKWLELSSTTWKPWVSFAVQLGLGLPHYIWCPKHQVAGDLVGITGMSITP